MRQNTEINKKSLLNKIDPMIDKLQTLKCEFKDFNHFINPELHTYAEEIDSASDILEKLKRRIDK